MSNQVTITVPKELSELSAERIVYMAVRGYKDYLYRSKRNSENARIIKEYRKQRRS